MLNKSYALNEKTIPSQAKSEEDFKQIESLGGSASMSMIVTLVIPFGFMLFMSMSMNRVWSLYLMMQLASNLNNFGTLILPANA